MNAREAWQELRKLLDTHAGTGGIQRLEELVLALYNGEGYPCDLARVIGGLDPKRFDLILALIKDYYERGESDELIELGRHIIDQRQSLNAPASTEG